MNRTLLLFSAFFFFFQSLHAQVKKTEDPWVKIDAMIARQGLVKTPMAEVTKAYAQAKKKGDEAMVIKALVYLVELKAVQLDNGDEKVLRDIEMERSVSKGAARAIITSLLAEHLEHYAGNRGFTYDLRKVFDEKDTGTWTQEYVRLKAQSLYLASLEEKELLQHTPAEAYDSLIKKGSDRSLRPTLYDLLAHRALDFFSGNSPDFRAPEHPFEANQPEAFAPAAVFAAHHFTTTDSTSNIFQSLLLYQQLIAFHVHDAKPNALIDADLARLGYVNKTSVLPDAKEFYRRSLAAVAEHYGHQPVASKAWYQLAAQYDEMGKTYTPFEDTTYRYERVKAKAILEKIVADTSVQNEGWYDARSLLDEIKSQECSFQLQSVNIPGQPFLSLFTYRNINKVDLRLIRLTDALKKLWEDDDNDDDHWEKLLAVTPLRQWQQSLPDPGDLQEHSAEVKLDALPVGEYLLVASYNGIFSIKNDDHDLDAALVRVSGISYINNNDNDFFVLDRETGRPLAGARVKFWGETYIPKKRGNSKPENNRYTTDANGFFRAVSHNGLQSDYIDITYRNDHLSVRNSIYISQSAPIKKFTPAVEEQRNTLTYLFTDRAIYRPAQTVYFKGIVTYTAASGPELRTGYQNTIYLKDFNNQPVDSIKVETNDFGSFSGKFILPPKVLGGRFSLHMRKGHGGLDFDVEEYKRPKFTVAFDTLRQAYRVNQSIHVRGRAQAFAGNTISGASVSYHILRRTSFFYSYVRNSASQEIKHGKTITDSAGGFTIDFTAIPDRSRDSTSLPVFNYEIEADVTDINGETHSSTLGVTAGYQSLRVYCRTQELILRDSVDHLDISTENMNGAFQPAPVQVTIFALAPEQRLLRSRLWERPDEHVFTREEFIRYFPHDPWDAEDKSENMPRKGIVLRTSATSRADGRFPLQGTQLPQGYYAVDISATDSEGHVIKITNYIEVFDRQQTAMVSPQYFWSQSDDRVLEPGDEEQIRLASGTDVFLIRQLKRSDEKKQQYDFDELNGVRKTYTIKATEADRGNIRFGYFFVRDNRFYEVEKSVLVPWNNKDLHIEYTSFRDKTMPGSSEKWTMKISGWKKEAAAAEVLASMYDASLDEFMEHRWEVPKPWPVNRGNMSWNSSESFGATVSQSNGEKYYGSYGNFFLDSYDRLALSMDQLMERAKHARFEFFQVRSLGMAKPGLIGTYKLTPPVIKPDNGVVLMSGEGVPPNLRSPMMGNAMPQMAYVVGTGTIDNNYKRANIAGYLKYGQGDTQSDAVEDQFNPAGKPVVQPRKNLNETAFFFPGLRTDTAGNVEFSFVAPEALTRWKVQTLAHTRSLDFGLDERELVTQKKLMVQPNMPRFLRQGDHLELTAKIANLSDTELTGQAQVELIDAATGQSVDGWFLNTFPNQYFTVAAGRSEVVSFPIQVPMQFTSLLTWRITAGTSGTGNKGITLSDGEENLLPVVTNRVLVTETLPLTVKGNGTKQFHFQKLLSSGNSETLQSQSLTIEYTSNPAWLVVQALPYLMEFPYEGAEQTWNRYYANALAGKIVQSAPAIRNVLDAWQNDTSALLSNLQKNEELKPSLLSETPWVLEAQSEATQKKNIALLYDTKTLGTAGSAALNKLSNLLSGRGGFPWFNGGGDDRYITQYILSGIGRLKKLGIPLDPQLVRMAARIISNIDEKISKDYAEVMKHKTKGIEIDATHVQYLYSRSFFTNMTPYQNPVAVNFYRKQGEKYWLQLSKSEQAMLAIVFQRSNRHALAQTIIRSLEEHSLYNEELGRYWKDNEFGRSWNWWYAPIETQSLLIEAFTEVGGAAKTIEELKMWLLKNKQANNWSTTKATADACYALLLRGGNWLGANPQVHISLGNLQMTTPNNAEAGTGHFKQSVEAKNISPQMGEISVTVAAAQTPGAPASWGAAYWQYFEDADKITAAATGLSLDKKLMIEKGSEQGPVLIPVEEGTVLHVGDKLRMVLRVKVDRDMQYVQLKDMRASVLEPVSTISGYDWQAGISFYKTTGDLSTNFFIDFLPKGTYVFDYPVFVSHTGDCSNGIATIQCLYAPEFSAHSEGVRVVVE